MNNIIITKINLFALLFFSNLYSANVKRQKQHPIKQRRQPVVAAPRLTALEHRRQQQIAIAQQQRKIAEDRRQRQIAAEAQRQRQLAERQRQQQLALELEYKKIQQFDKYYKRCGICNQPYPIQGDCNCPGSNYISTHGSDGGNPRSYSPRNEK